MAGGGGDLQDGIGMFCDERRMAVGGRRKRVIGSQSCELVDGLLKRAIMGVRRWVAGGLLAKNGSTQSIEVAREV